MTDELYHFGVKGMKWGVRKAQKQINKAESRSNKIGTNRKHIPEKLTPFIDLRKQKVNHLLIGT